jgi:hypothetical protein
VANGDSWRIGRAPGEGAAPVLEEMQDEFRLFRALLLARLGQRSR